MTLQEKYYALNGAISDFMLSQSIDCPLVKFGVDIGTVRSSLKNQQVDRYPYFQTSLLNPKPQYATAKESGIYTEFEYQVSFFTSPHSEKDDDTALWRPWQVLEVIFSDINLGVFRSNPSQVNTPMIANLLRYRTIPTSEMVSGAFVPKSVLLAEFAAVCTYPDLGTAGDTTYATNVIDSITIEREN